MKKLLFPLAFLICFIIIIMGCSHTHDTICIEKTIVSIGGCNSRGYCGVMYYGGYYGNEYYPVAGKIIKNYY